jgi:hypothetical protein
MKGRGLWVGVAVLVSAAIASGAQADGLPVLGIDVGGVGVVARSGGVRYVTIPAGAKTVLARVRTSDGQIVDSRLLPGRFTIPAVAYDWSAGGLSADGRSLVLIEPRQSFPRASTRIATIDVGRGLRPRRTITLLGDFSFDAISPRGSLVYLIEYVSPNDPTRYLVRAYDVRAGRLLAKAISDPRERGDKMRGNPLTRVGSSDGRWAYTLYDGGGATPFVHALDTSTGTARCIDLAALAGSGLWRLRLGFDPAGHTLTVRRGRQSLAMIDTSSFRVRLPAPASAGSGPSRTSRPEAGGSWPVIVFPSLAVFVLGAASLLVVRRRRRLLLPVE